MRRSFTAAITAAMLLITSAVGGAAACAGDAPPSVSAVPIRETAPIQTDGGEQSEPSTAQVRVVRSVVSTAVPTELGRSQATPPAISYQAYPTPFSQRTAENAEIGVALGVDRSLMPKALESFEAGQGLDPGLARPESWINAAGEFALLDDDAVRNRTADPVVRVDLIEHPLREELHLLRLVIAAPEAVDSQGQASAFADRTLARMRWNADSVLEWRLIGYVDRVGDESLFRRAGGGQATLGYGETLTLFFELELSGDREASLGELELSYRPLSRGGAGQLPVSRSHAIDPVSEPSTGDARLQLGALVALAADRYQWLGRRGLEDRQRRQWTADLAALDKLVRELDSSLLESDIGQTFARLIAEMARAASAGGGRV